MLTRLLPALALLSLLPASFGQSISGQIVDSNGVGVAAVNIDVKNLGGGDDPPLANDSTDPGGFFNVAVPAGFYDIIFFPPEPPATSHLVLTVEEVLLTGALNMGVLALEPGVALSGRVLGPGGSPVDGLDIDLVAGGEALHVPGDQTDDMGEFLIAAPFGEVEIQFEPSTTGSPLLAPEHLLLNLGSNTDVGDVQLLSGFVVTATVSGPGGAVESADLDFIEKATNIERYTPGDNTNGSGFVDVVVPAGTYEVEVCPQFADLLAGASLDNVVVGSNTSLGTIVLSAGVVLSGHVMDSGGAPVVNADLDVRDSATQFGVTTCQDNTDASGNYAIVIPTGTFDVIFTPPPGAPLSSLTVTSYTVSGNQVLNATLPDGGTGNYCQSNPFSTGQPSMMSTNLTTVSIVANNLQLAADNLPMQPGQFIASSASFQTPFQNGFLCVNPSGLQRLLPITVPAASGVASINVDFVAGAQGIAGPLSVNVVAGTTHYFQRWNRDPGVGTGSNLSDGISVDIVP